MSQKNTNFMYRLFVYVLLTAAYFLLQDDLPTTFIIYGYYFIWQPLVVTSQHFVPHSTIIELAISDDL
jgi:hypothetical protein